MIGQATAALEGRPRRWLQRAWGLPHIHARQDWWVVWPALADLPGTGIRVLDAGCGSGRWALELAARRPEWTLVGLDRDAGRIAAAERSRRRLGLDNVEFIHSGFAEYAAARPFDVVLSVCSAHYEASSGANTLFACAADCLKPAGSLLLYGPRARDEVPWTAGFPRPEWHVVFTASQLESLCQRYRFQLESLDGHVGRPGTLVKQLDLLAAGPRRRVAMLGLYGIEYALAAVDRRLRVQRGGPTLMWLLRARRRD